MCGLRFTSHLSFVYVVSVTCTTVNGSLTVCNILISGGILKMASNVCREVNEVREERLRRECDKPGGQQCSKIAYEIM